MDKKVISVKSSNSLQKSRPKKITHLYCNDKYLKNIPKIPSVKNLIVLYLHNNEIYEITNLESAQNLSSLYLQGNNIHKIENLDNLKRLKKLYLDHNLISVVENLHNLERLEELHIEKQSLQLGSSLCFDPRSVYALSMTLQVLNVSHNKIESISSLAPLKSLKVLNASYNNLSDIQEVCSVIKEWFYLRNLSLIHNPICKSRLYKEDIIASAYCLEILDEKEISDHTRVFFKKLHNERLAQRLHKSYNLGDKIPELSKKYSSAIQKAVSIHILKQSKELSGDSTEIFDERNAIYIPWKTLPKPQNNSKLLLTKKKKSHGQKATVINTSFSDLKI